MQILLQLVLGVDDGAGGADLVHPFDLVDRIGRVAGRDAGVLYEIDPLLAQLVAVEGGVQFISTMLESPSCCSVWTAVSMEVLITGRTTLLAQFTSAS